MYPNEDSAVWDVNGIKPNLKGREGVGEGDRGVSEREGQGMNCVMSVMHLGTLRA